METPSTPIIAGLKAVDWLGSLALLGSTVAILLGLEFGGVIFAWSSTKVLCLIAFGLMMGALFFLNEAKLARYPVMPLHLFKRRSNIAALLFAFLHGLVNTPCLACNTYVLICYKTYFSATYYLPFYAQAVRGYAPLQSGIFVIPFEVSLSISCAISSILIRVTGE